MSRAFCDAHLFVDPLLEVLVVVEDILLAQVRLLGFGSLTTRTRLFPTPNAAEPACTRE